MSQYRCTCPPDPCPACLEYEINNGSEIDEQMELAGHVPANDQEPVGQMSLLSSQHWDVAALLAELNALAADIKRHRAAFRKQESKIEGTRLELHRAQERYAQVAAMLQETLGKARKRA